MSNQKLIVKLTKLDGSPILVGVESIIQANEVINSKNELCTKIQSRGAMIETCWVTESIDKIWEIINKTKEG
jgi:hypothetical protein